MAFQLFTLGDKNTTGSHEKNNIKFEIYNLKNILQVA